MAYSTGTATGYLDLLDKVKAAAVAQGWTVERETYVSATSTDGDLILNGPGLASDQRIIVGFKTYNSVAGDYYNWEVRGARSYISETFDTLTDKSSPVYVYLQNSTMTYWLFVNKQRIMLIAKVNTVFIHMYTGFINSFGTEDEWDYPCLIGGSGTVATYRWSSSYVSAWWDRADNGSSFYMWMPDDVWIIGNNSYAQNPTVWPWIEDNNSIGRIRDTFGDYPLKPALIWSSEDLPGRAGAFGEVDGLYWTTGYSLNSEDTITVGADVYLVTQNVDNTNIYNYCAVKEA